MKGDGSADKQGPRQGTGKYATDLHGCQKQNDHYKSVMAVFVMLDQTAYVAGWGLSYLLIPLFFIFLFLLFSYAGRNDDTQFIQQP